MEDYIDILLENLSEHLNEYLNASYFAQEKTAANALKSLMETCTDAQKKLLLAYEEALNTADSISELTLARQAFLLAKTIYR